MADTKTEKQKVKEITDKLEEGLKELFESEKYKSYLSTMSKFHNYSFNNTLLITLQRPDATLVAGYQAWQKNFNRHVNKGEKGIRILAPAPYKIKEERNKLDPVTGEVMLDKDGMPQTEEVEVKIPAFRAVSVFDISQTEGEPIPELEAKELLSTVDGYEDFIKAVTFVSPVPVGFEDIPGGSKGYFNIAEKRIAVQEGMSESQTLKTMVHETAHAMLHDKDVNQDISVPAKDRNTKEVEAESIAFTVCRHFGIDTSDYSFSYIAGWSTGRDMKELKSSLDVIRRTASELITGIEGQLREFQRDRELMQAQEKECLLLVQNGDLSEYSLLNVRGMDAAEVAEALSSMNENDRLNVAAYLESRGAWTTEIANEGTKEFGEHHLDVRYNTDTGEITDFRAEMTEIEPEKEVKEPAGIEGDALDAAGEETGELPDPMITPAEMQEYGYTWEEMLPLTKEKALELFDGDLTVYLLHEDGSEAMVESREQIEGHEGIFGIEKTDWEDERDYRSMQAELAEDRAAREAQLLYGASDRYGIYQLKDSPELRDFRFAGTLDLLKMGLLSDDFREIQPGNYNLVYAGELSDIDGYSQREKLDAVFLKFNTDHPADYKGHSLSVSDIVVLHKDGRNSAHFVDSVGFMELPEFIRALEGVKEQDREEIVAGEPAQETPQGEVQDTSYQQAEPVDYMNVNQSAKQIDLKSEPENTLTDEEKQFLETYDSSLFAKKFLAWDEIESLGYCFFEDGYIDRFKPTVKALYGDGMVPEPKIHDIARRMRGGEDVREELAKALMGGYDREIYVGENAATAVFGSDAVTVTLGNAEKKFFYEEIGTAFLGLMESEYRDIEQARAADEREEVQDTSGHDVQKSELEQAEQPETQTEQIEPEQPEGQAEGNEPEQDTEMSELEDIEGGDEIIDLGDEVDQVLAEMKQSLESRQDTSGHHVQKSEQAEPEETAETELAFQIADRYISIQETDGGYDYSIMDADYKLIDGGVYENPDVPIREALEDIVADLKENPFDNGTRGNIHDDDELMPIDYDDLMEKAEAADRTRPQRNVVEDFRARTNELFHEVSGMNPAEIEETVKCHVQAKLEEYGMDAEIVGAAVVGSRCRGLERKGSDLDVVVELSTDEREDSLFDALNEDGLCIGGVKVDINPITAQRTGTLETYLPQVEEYLAGVREAREKEPSMTPQEQPETEVTFTVAECGEYHNLGEFYENIPTVEEALAIWKQIPAERMNGIPAIGIHIHTPGTEAMEDVGIDVLSGRRIDLSILEYIPDIRENPQAMERIAELVAKLPDVEIDGVMSEEFEAKVWELRMPELSPAERLAVEFDRLFYDYDGALYHDSIRSMTENVEELHGLIKQGDTEDLSGWLNEVISGNGVSEEAERAKELLAKLAEYKPLAKVEEMEEQNYNMVDNVPNNGAGEKAGKGGNKMEHDKPASRMSLKARLAEKKAQIAGQGTDVQENTKNKHREM